jgi:UDP-glucose 4-epimerase
LQVAASDKAYGEVFNVGTGIAISFIGLAKKIVEVAKGGKVAFTEFTQERKEVEPGDYYTDISKIKRVIGWKPQTTLEEGLRRTIEFYRNYKKEYWG